MKKQFGQKLMVMIFVGMLGLVLVACSLPGSADGGGLLGSVGGERAIPATPFLEGETVDYGDEVLILREVSAGEGNLIEKIVIWLPSPVSQLTLNVNGSPAVSSKVDEDTVVELASPAAVVLLTFKDENGDIIKMCEIDLNDILAPGGDCAW